MVEQALKKKLYVVVREDLPKGLRAAQACHAVAEAASCLPEAFRRWGNEYLIVLGATDMDDLIAAYYRTSAVGEGTIHPTPWREPDMPLGDDFTAFAFFDFEELNVLQDYPLAFRRRWLRWFRRD